MQSKQIDCASSSLNFLSFSFFLLILALWKHTAFFSELPSLGTDLKEKKLLKIGTFNVKNIETNLVYVKELLKSYDVLAVQEHWLFTFQLSNFDNHFNTHYTYSKAVDSENPLPPTQKPQGYGEVAILCRCNIL